MLIPDETILHCRRERGEDRSICPHDREREACPRCVKADRLKRERAEFEARPGRVLEYLEGADSDGIRIDEVAWALDCTEDQVIAAIHYYGSDLRGYEIIRDREGAWRFLWTHE